MSRIAALPTLGAGLGFREPFRAELFRSPGAVDFLEIVADHYLESAPEKLAELDLLAAHFALIPHGLDLSLGSSEGLDRHYLDRLARLVHRLDPPWWSEHLSLTRAGGVEIGHLTPLPFTHEAVSVVCRNIAAVQARIETPLILENITYPFLLPGSELTEAEFLTEVVERSGCGLLLDVTNLYTNAVNHGFDPYAALSALPLEAVVQLHFVGGYEEHGVLIDSHSRPTPPAVWELMDAVLARAPVKGIILERDEDLPPFAELETEVSRARDLGRKHGRWD
ncbi:MAG: hypothetical protein K0Q72_3416 [Armatimonadetes bacterium]|nr:hypothetical protein [Armatimonadota bacterium]